VFFSCFSICVMPSCISPILDTLPTHHPSPRPCATLHKRLWIIVSPLANHQAEEITLVGSPHLLVPLPYMFGGAVVPHPSQKLQVQSTANSPFCIFSLLLWDALPGTNQDHDVVWWYNRIVFLEICAANTCNLSG